MCVHFPTTARRFLFSRDQVETDRQGLPRFSGLSTEVSGQISLAAPQTWAALHGLSIKQHRKALITEATRSFPWMIPFSQMGISVHFVPTSFCFFFYAEDEFPYPTKVPPQRCERGSLLVRPKHLVASEIGFSVTANWEKGNESFETWVKPHPDSFSLGEAASLYKQHG